MRLSLCLIFIFLVTTEAQFSDLKSGDVLIGWNQIVSAWKDSLGTYRLKHSNSGSCLALSIRDVQPQLFLSPCVDTLEQMFFFTKTRRFLVATQAVQQKYQLYDVYQAQLTSASAMTRLSSCALDNVNASSNQPQLIYPCSDYTRCLAMDTSGTAQFADECDEFILQRDNSDINRFRAQVVVQDAATLNVFQFQFQIALSLVGDLTSGATEYRWRIVWTNPAMCVAFGPSDTDPVPRLHRAPCTLDRQQKFYMGSGVWYVILPIADSELYEVHRLRMESTPDDDLLSRFRVISDKMAIDADNHDTCNWGSGSFECGTNYVQIQGPSNCNLSTITGGLSCGSYPASPFYLEFIHSCDDQQNCQVTIGSHAEKRRLGEGEIRDDGTVPVQAVSRRLRSRWTVSLNGVGPITRTDLDGNQYCWVLVNQTLLSFMTRRAGAKRHSQTTLSQKKPRQTISPSLCTQFSVNQWPKESMPADSFFKYCLNFRGDEGFFVRDLNNQKLCDPIVDRDRSAKDNLFHTPAVTGRIMTYPGGLCLSFVPDQGLILQTCQKPSGIIPLSHRFGYDFDSKRLLGTLPDKTTTALFFWWRGSIHSYNPIPFQFRDSSQYYAWDMNTQGSVAPIVAIDKRGYSGTCLSYVSQTPGAEVTVSQNCSLFQFDPMKQVSLTSTANVRIRYTVGNKNLCLASVIDAAGTPYIEGRPCESGLAISDQSPIPPRMVFTVNLQAPKDIRQEFRLRSSDGFVTGADFGSPPALTTIKKGGVTKTFFLSLSTDTINDGDKTGCWSIQNNRVYIWPFQRGVSAGQCTKFTVEPIYKIVSNMPRSVFVVSGIDSLYRSPLLEDFGYPGVNQYDMQGSAFFLNEQAGTLSINPDGTSRTALLLPTTVQRNPDGSPLLPWSEPNFQAPLYGLIQISFVPYMTQPPSGVSYLLMSNWKNSGCVVYLTSGSRLGLKCYKLGKQISSCLSQNIIMSNRFSRQVYNLFNNVSTDVVPTVALLYSTKAGTDNIIFLNGSPVLRCPTSESWTPLAGKIQFLDDNSQWQYQPLGAIVRSASFMESHIYQDLVTVAQMAAKPTLNYTSTPETLVSTSWSNCYAITNASKISAVRCNVSLSGLDVGALSLACSRPGCAIEIISQSPVVVEYRPNYPRQFKSEDVGSFVQLVDDAWLTDGFSSYRFQANMDFTQQSSNLEVLEEVDNTGALQVGDSFKYMCVERFLNINRQRLPAIAAVDDIF